LEVVYLAVRQYMTVEERRREGEREGKDREGEGRTRGRQRPREKRNDAEGNYVTSAAWQEPGEGGVTETVEVEARTWGSPERKMQK
jgi:hypothetical protein